MAGRKDKNIVDYFPHYCMAGKTLFIIESKFGHLGYSIWFKTLELLGSNENHYIDLRNESDLLFIISKLKITEQEFTDIYNMLSKLEAIDSFLWSKKIIYSENFVKNIEDAYKRRSNKCMHKLDLCNHLNIKCTQKVSKSNQKYAKKSKVKKSKEEYIKEFNIFWDNYSKITGLNKTDKESVLKYWNKLTDQEKQKAIDNIKPYFDSLSDKKYCKKARTYLSDKNFNDEYDNSHSSKQNKELTSTVLPRSPKPIPKDIYD